VPRVPWTGVRVRVRVTHIDPHRCIPPVGDRRQPRIQRGPQIGDDIRQRIREVFVLAASEAVPRHDDVAAEMPIAGMWPPLRESMSMAPSTMARMETADTPSLAVESRKSRVCDATEGRHAPT
jgi:hypothetical protein